MEEVNRSVGYRNHNLDKITVILVVDLVFYVQYYARNRLSKFENSNAKWTKIVERSCLESVQLEPSSYEVHSESPSSGK